jgi:hypothetical protein
MFCAWGNPFFGVAKTTGKEGKWSRKHWPT